MSAFVQVILNRVSALINWKRKPALVKLNQKGNHWRVFTGALAFADPKLSFLRGIWNIPLNSIPSCPLPCLTPVPLPSLSFLISLPSPTSCLSELPFTLLQASLPLLMHLPFPLVL